MLIFNVFTLVDILVLEFTLFTIDILCVYDTIIEHTIVHSIIK